MHHKNKENQPSKSNNKPKKYHKFKNFIQKHKIEIICVAIILVAGIAVIFSAFMAYGMQPAIFAGGDFAFHISRFLGTVDALKDGQIIPQIAPMVHNGLGMGFNIFYGQFIPYLITALYVIIRNWGIAINIIFCLLYLGIGLSCWFSVRHITKSNFIGLISGLALMLATGHATGYYYAFCGFTPGMIAAYIGLPLIVAGIYGILQDQKKSIRLIIIGACFLILNSILGAIISLIVAGVIAICHWKQLFTKRHMLTLVISLLTILGLTAFFTLPMLEAKGATTYASYVPGYMSSNHDAAASVPDITELFNYTYSNYDTNQGLPLHFLLAFIGAAILLIVRYRQKTHKNIETRLILSLFVAALIGFILIGPFIPWQNMPLFTTIFQYSGRFNLVFLFPTAFLLGILLNEIRKKAHFVTRKNVYYFCCACTIIILSLSWIGISYPNSKSITSLSLNPSNSVNWGYNQLNDGNIESGLGECDYMPIALVYYLFGDDIDLSGQNAAGSSVCINHDVTNKIPTQPTIISGTFKINNFSKQGTHESMEISDNNSGGTIELPASYYPGYKAAINGVALETVVSEKGLVEVIIPENVNGELTVYYGISFATATGTIISGLTFVSCIIFCIYRNHQQKRQQLTL